MNDWKYSDLYVPVRYDAGLWECAPASEGWWKLSVGDIEGMMEVWTCMIGGYLAWKQKMPLYFFGCLETKFWKGWIGFRQGEGIYTRIFVLFRKFTTPWLCLHSAIIDCLPLHDILDDPPLLYLHCLGMDVWPHQQRSNKRPHTSKLVWSVRMLCVSN